MTTPAFDESQPNTNVGNSRQAAEAASNANHLSLRDLLIMLGSVPSWNRTPYGANKRYPDGVISSKGLEQFDVQLTWGTTGGAKNRIVKTVYYHSENGGTSWSPFPFDAAGNFVRIRSWDALGNWAGDTWSNTP
ncbi:MAG: hypothetical protein KDG52_21805 [Rhodocyclaceae bacterium]|nr:hypothetical protein [Caldilineaceae bacterium]MCB1918335.1 hypothetical protein [Rhodocyclaceae bacterium]